MSEAAPTRDELKARFADLMSIRPGETPVDRSARKAACLVVGQAQAIPGLRRGAQRANAHLTSLDVPKAERIDLIRASLPVWVSWLAAEVVNELGSAERFADWAYEDAGFE